MLTAKTTTGYTIEMRSGNHTWFADEPEDVGDDRGPDPYALLLSALASCTLMTVRMYAKRKGWPLESASLTLDQSHVHAEDCANCEHDGNARINFIKGTISFEGPLEPAARERLLAVAKNCPVHRTMKMQTYIELAAT